jgi:hypothetical protein
MAAHETSEAKRSWWVLTDEQRAVLEEVFGQTPYPNEVIKADLSRRIGEKPDRVNVC